ncbi:MAG TPA: phosphotransferase family protein [Aeromicrobium sp.]|nr:phosphotransferase family protein [Aeromicrobium sp.]
MTEPAEFQLTVHQRDPAALAEAIGTWLPTVLGADGAVRVSDVDVPQGAGMSSVTVLFTAAWSRDGASEERRLVARMAPDPGSFPVFPEYDLERQAAVLRAVGAGTDVPVPEVVGLESTGAVLGAPFIVMNAVAGRTPSDNPPYVFGGWLLDAAPSERRALQDRTVEVIAGIHALPGPESVLPELVSPDTLRDHVVRERAYYEWTRADDGITIPVLDRASDWLEDNWPAEVSPSGLIWGDARPGNVLYDGFEPCAVLDWEMTALGPPEVDLGWIVFIHCFFQDIAKVFELPGLPDFCRPDDVVATYERASGRRVQDLYWYIVYAALRHGIVMSRVKRRMIHFGEEQRPEQPDDYVMHAAALDALIEGTYTWD